MATGAANGKLSMEERKVVVAALRLYRKSQERAARASSNETIKNEFDRLDKQAMSLANKFEYNELDLG